MINIEHESVKDDEDRKRLQDDSKNYEELNFEKVKTDDTYNKNLINCKKILTMWQFSNRGYKKVNEVYIFDEIKNIVRFSKDGRYLSILLKNKNSLVIYDAQSLTK